MLLQLLYAQAEAEPDRTAIVYRDERLSLTELVERIERLADGLSKQGIGAGDAVGLVLRDDPWFVAAFHAIAALGAKVVPANPAFKQAELDFWFRSTGVRAVISDERTAGVCERIVAGFDSPVQVIGSGAGHGQSVTLAGLVEEGSAERLEARSPQEPLVGQFSSGSTGRPKRLDRTHGQCIAEAESYLGLGLTAEDKILAAVPLFHTWGMGACIFGAAVSGATLVILEDPHPFLLKRHRALELIENEKVTVFPGVPFNYRLMADSPADADLSSLRLCFTAGMAMPRETFESFGERFGVLVRQLYGSTETGMIAANLSDDPVSTFESVGTPVQGVSLGIVDDDGADLPQGEVGEITVASAAATEGYGDLPELNKVAFRDGRFFTGDLGRLDEHGMLYIEGRKKLLIETGGFKVDPIEVESVLDAHPAVAESVVVGVDTEVAGEQKVKAVAVLEGECEERELIAFCRERLANFKVPQSVEFRDEIPKSPLGKVLRKYLV
ncbi:MAG: long-chain acyl-CoA synthetase [Solirubrobacterales bacterium]|nr:long-chain acyl-CoA synthetase [Solirubrobacterales bacterium]